MLQEVIRLSGCLARAAEEDESSESYAVPWAQPVRLTPSIWTLGLSLYSPFMFLSWTSSNGEQIHALSFFCHFWELVQPRTPGPPLLCQASSFKRKARPVRSEGSILVPPWICYAPLSDGISFVSTLGIQTKWRSSFIPLTFELLLLLRWPRRESKNEEDETLALKKLPA